MKKRLDEVLVKAILSLSEYWSPGCFTANTLVLTPFGKREISDIRVGDFVYSFDTYSGVVTTRRVLESLRRSSQQIWDVSFDNDETVGVTAHHSFFSASGKWKRVCTLRFGEAVHTLDGLTTVKRLEKTDRCEPVFNLVTEGEHTFLAHGCVVHNFTMFRAVRSTASRLLNPRINRPAHGHLCSKHHSLAFSEF